MDAPDDTPDDGVCQRCGRCCHGRYLVNGEMYVVRNYACTFLDGLTGLCKVFSVRHKEAPWCQTVEVSIVQRAYPADCPYVRGIPGYRPPIEVDNIEAIKAIVGVDK